MKVDGQNETRKRDSTLEFEYNNLLSLALFLFCFDGTANGEEDIVDKTDPVYRERLTRTQRTDVHSMLWA